MTSFLNHQRGAGQHGNEVNDNHRRGRGFWLPWIRQTQENNRTPFHNNTCQIRTGLAHTTTYFYELLSMIPSILRIAYFNLVKAAALLIFFGVIIYCTWQN